MLQAYVIPALQQRVCLQETIFLLNGDRPRNASSVQQLLRQTLTDVRMNIRSFPTAWPPRSPDLTPCEFWLWNFLKDNVYLELLTTVLDLKNSIRRRKRHLVAIFSTIFLFQKPQVHHLKCQLPKYFSLWTSRTASRAVCE
ncbi:uncharacterized protein TNCV_4990611 [Trichonephila clavipes]|nr:uncharacterized protein TNCV_4990611 [Trichonephila clavipes]